MAGRFAPSTGPPAECSDEEHAARERVQRRLTDVLCDLWNASLDALEFDAELAHRLRQVRRQVEALE